MQENERLARIEDNTNYIKRSLARLEPLVNNHEVRMSVMEAKEQERKDGRVLFWTVVLALATIAGSIGAFASFAVVHK